MYQMDAGLFVEIARVSGYFSGFATAQPEVDKGPMAKHSVNFEEPDHDLLIGLYGRIEEDCTKMGFPASAASAKRIKALFESPGITYKTMREHYEEFQGRLRDELNSTFCLAIEGRHLAYYETPNRFGEAVAKRFPATADDIEEAGKCIAVGRPTASVFHLMRALEVGLQGFADKLGIVFNKDRNWQAILNSVNGAIKSLPRATREEKEYLGKCSATSLFLEQVKDAWRNDVMHPRAVYTPEQAEEIDTLARSLMVKLAGFV